MQDIALILEKLRGLEPMLLTTKKKTKTLELLNEYLLEVSSLLESIDGNRKLLAVKKNLNSLKEILSGSLRGLEIDEISRGEFLLGIENLSNFIEKADLEFQKSEDRKQTSKYSKYNQEESEDMESSSTNKDINIALVEQSLSADWQKTLKQVRDKLEKPQSPTEVDKNPDEEKLKAKFAAFDLQAKDSPSSMQGKAFGLAILPVIPLYDDFSITQSENLARLGIQHTLFEGYAIFEKQKILYFSAKKVKELNRENKDQQTNIEFAQDLVDLINSRNSVKYSIASDITKISHKNNDIVLVWLLPQTVLNALLNKQISSGGKRGRSGNLRDWSFPFSR
jgi:hypothetical protein